MLAFFLLAILPAGVFGLEYWAFSFLTGNFRVIAFLFLALQAVTYMFRLIRFLGGRLINGQYREEGF